MNAKQRESKRKGSPLWLPIYDGVLAVVFLLTHFVSAQTNHFFYDNLGRIAVVIATNGTDSVLYNYDAVGNITSIVSVLTTGS